MFNVDNLTGHVRMRPRQELARTVRCVAEKIGLATPTKDGLMSAADKTKLNGLEVVNELGEIDIYVECRDDGIVIPSDMYSEERYVRLHFYGGASSDIGDTFDLGWLDVGMATGVIYYFLIFNDAGYDINIMVGGSGYAPADTVVKAGCVREASLYRCGDGSYVLTMSDNLEGY
ncbi:MAG: hypothetical protein K2H70_04200 [Bacteroidales bacterium]|nr:hypothetical protein [Bacteroidales bacterium]